MSKAKDKRSKPATTPQRRGKGKTAGRGQKPATGQQGASLKTLAQAFVRELETEELTGYTDPKGRQGKRGNETHLAPTAVPTLAEVMRTIARRLRESAADGQPERDRLAQSLNEALPALIEAALLLEKIINRDCEHLAPEARADAIRKATAWPVAYLAHAGERSRALDIMAKELAALGAGLTMKTKGKGLASVHVQAALDVIRAATQLLPVFVAVQKWKREDPDWAGQYADAPIPCDREGRVILPKEDRIDKRWEKVFDYVAEQRHKARDVFGKGNWGDHMNKIRPAILRNVDCGRFYAAARAAVEGIELRRRQAMDAGAASRREQAAEIEAESKRLAQMERQIIAAAGSSSGAKRKKA